MELKAELRHRASEIGEGWSDHKMMLRAADEIERLQNTLREIYQQPDGARCKAADAMSTEIAPLSAVRVEPVVSDHLTLKWGALKAWNLTSPKGRDLLEKYFAIGSNMSAMARNDTAEKKELICKVIDECGATEIYLAWDGVYVSKEAAKKYVMEYGA